MVTRHEGEEIIGEDEFKRPILSTNIQKGDGVTWLDCEECGNMILLDSNGKTFYHKKKCSLSNGIGYNEERINTTLPHHKQCDCYTCKPPKEKK